MRAQGRRREALRAGTRKEIKSGYGLDGDRGSLCEVAAKLPTT